MTARTTVYRVRLIDPARPDQLIVWFDDIATIEKAEARAVLSRADKPGWTVIVEAQTITYSDWAPYDAVATIHLIG